MLRGIIAFILRWFRAARRRKCRHCSYFAEHYITALDGQGLFRFGYCQRLVHDCKVVEPDIERKCEEFRTIKSETEFTTTL